MVKEDEKIKYQNPLHYQMGSWDTKFLTGYYRIWLTRSKRPWSRHNEEGQWWEIPSQSKHNLVSLLYFGGQTALYWEFSATQKPTHKMQCSDRPYRDLITECIVQPWIYAHDSRFVLFWGGGEPAGFIHITIGLIHWRWNNYTTVLVA